MTNGIIFDFNGTMIQDSAIQEQAWFDFLTQHSREPLDRAEVLTEIHGQTNDHILTHFLGALTKAEIQSLAEQKEARYRQLLQASPEIQLTRGLPAYLQLLKSRQTPITIATASPKTNVDFFIHYYDLTRWFDPKLFVYDDGQLPGKPEPDIFQKAAANLNCSPKACTVFEDSRAGFTAAKRAQIGKIMLIDPSGQQKTNFLDTNRPQDQVITDFQPLI